TVVSEGAALGGGPEAEPHAARRNSTIDPPPNERKSVMPRDCSTGPHRAIARKSCFARPAARDRDFRHTERGRSGYAEAMRVVPIAAPLLLGACTLLVGTDDLSGGAVDGGAPAEGGVPEADTHADASPEANGPDARSPSAYRDLVLSDKP